MSRVRRMQLKYGTIYGGVAFGVTVLVGLWLVSSVENLPMPVLKAGLWASMDMHGIGAELGFLGTASVETVAGITASGYRWLPPVVIGVAAALSAGEFWSNRPAHVVQNAGCVALGYGGALLVVFILSGVQPRFSSMAILMLLLLGSVVVAGRLVGGLFGVPVLGIVSLWGLLFVGFIVFLGGITVIGLFGYAMIQMALGIGGGAGLTYLIQR